VALVVTPGAPERLPEPEMTDRLGLRLPQILRRRGGKRLKSGVFVGWVERV